MSKGKESRIFRKVGLTVLIISGLALAASAGAYAATKLSLTVNGHKSSAEPVSIKGVTYVPLRSVAELLGANVNYNASSGAIAVTSKSGVGNEAVASVNGASISKSQLYDAMAALGGAQTLDTLIQEELVKQEADKKAIVISAQDIDAEVARIKKQFTSEADFQAALQQSGMTLDSLKKQIPMQLRIRKLLEPQAKVTDDEVKQYFEANKASYGQPEQVRASHILVATQAEADDIEKQLKAGADFAALAKAKSLDTGSKDAGGDLGFFGKGTMVPEFEQAAFSLKVGEVSDPVKSQYGYHVIKVTDHKDAVTATFESKQAEIRDQLVQQKISQLASTYLADLKAKAKITNTLQK